MASTAFPAADATAADATAAVSPGTVFAAAFAARGEHTRVSCDYTITDAHRPDRPKPRLTVRGLLKRRPADQDVHASAEQVLVEREQCQTRTGDLTPRRL